MNNTTWLGALAAADEGSFERREEERVKTVFRLARIADRHGDDLVLIRNISELGAQVETDHVLHEGDRVTIELRSDRRIEGIVRWVKPGAAGIAFVHPITVSRILNAEPLPSAQAASRLPRFARNARAILAAGPDQLVAPTINISLAGACIDAPRIAGFGDKEAVIIRIDGFEPCEARIRWVGQEGLGLEFDKPLSFRAFEHWLRNHAARN